MERCKSYRFSTRPFRALISFLRSSSSGPSVVPMSPGARYDDTVGRAYICVVMYPVKSDNAWIVCWKGLVWDRAGGRVFRRVEREAKSGVGGEEACAL